MKILLTKPQMEFVSAKDQFPAMVAGFGAGKTQAAIHRCTSLKLKYPKNNVAYYLPTYDLVRTIAVPRFSEILTDMCIPFKYLKSDNMMELGKQGAWGRVIFRTMDNPDKIVGYEVADSLVDELDTLPRDKAADVWRKIIARNRQKKHDGSLNTTGVATTPEGFRFVYDQWVKKVRAGYRVIHASTWSNKKNLPDGYIAGLEESYPAHLLEAYLKGLFVNLTSGSVYHEFSREKNKTDGIYEPLETLHIGMDFNVGKMAAVAHVLRRDDEIWAVDEIVDVLDTPAMVRSIKEKYPKNPIIVYPDASGGNRKTNNASESDISILRDAGFQVLAPRANGRVRDRILAFNAMINLNGKRRYKVNLWKCPHLVESLEKQAYDKNGEPDKATGLDHIVDAPGYFIVYKFPVVKRLAIVQELEA